MAHRRRFTLFPSLLISALLAAGCGSNDDSQDITGEPFSASNVTDFSLQLDNVQGLVEDGDCDGAIQKVGTLSGAVDQISSDVDQGLKDDLKSLLDKLGTQIADECQQTTTTTTSSSTEETDTAPTTDATTTATTTTTIETDTTGEQPADEGDQGNGNGGTPPGNGNGGTPPGQGGGTPHDPGGTPPGQGPPTSGGDSGGIAPRGAR